ncbi:hypothetical protein RSOLAG1IB_10119 [Rhizoctonia solani AG-1 IB]|uniref:C2H2-type domain-containing protein n=1 Tax=Thanatephorus cucumeris (strain AG1-IB / isolate 7/3/14) TaxID=1108050 RepID=A0A0B7FUF6_THACB|nr:hypothetical protein RSOLAG1IB_10119 [Rhizoctonia solani AG-1 IB]
MKTNHIITFTSPLNQRATDLMPSSTYSSQAHLGGAAQVGCFYILKLTDLTLAWTEQPPIAWFEVPRGRLNKAEVDQLVANFKAGPGRNAKEARCSWCYHEGKTKHWDTRPANLRRHLYAHFEIKCYGCLLCDAQFTTRDQAVVHGKDHHTADKSRELGRTFVYPLFPEQTE